MLYAHSLSIFLLPFCDSEETYGERSMQAAVCWYEYGNALLSSVEAHPSHALDNDNEKWDGDGDGDGEDEPEGDLQIAWEALDVSNQ